MKHQLAEQDLPCFAKGRHCGLIGLYSERSYSGYLDHPFLKNDTQQENKQVF